MRVQSGHLSISITAVLVSLCAITFAAPPTYTISGIVQTAAGIGIEGVSLTGNNGAGSAVTAADGSYSLTVPNHWSGTITASKTGWLITPASRTYTSVSEDRPNENYEAYQPKISGTVTNRDGTPLAGVTLTANNSSGTTTTAAGYYELTVPYNWSGTLSASLPGYNFTAKSYTNITSNQPNQNFSGFQPVISGYVRSTDGAPLNGATVTADNGGGSATTNASGYYEVVVPYRWSGAVAATLTGYLFTPHTYSNVTASFPNQNFSGFRPTISGSTGVAGATVTAGGRGSVVSTPTYTISVPYGWSGTVEASLTGYHFPDSPKSYTNVTANLSGQNFTPYQPKISGYVRKADASGCVDVTVSADNGGGATVTSASGYYEIRVPYGWAGTVTADKYNLSFSPESYNYSTLNTDQSNQDFAIAYAGVITVKADGTGDVSAIQDAIDIAVDGDIVQVEDGTYTGTGNRDIEFRGKAITVRGNVTDPNQVVIDCQGISSDPHRGFKFISGEDQNCILEGFTITNGYGPKESISGGLPYSVGGAIYCRYSGPIINNCVITNNWVVSNGGGIYVFQGDPSINSCIFSNNVACSIFIRNSSLNITHSIIHDNGGGICGTSNSQVTVDDCTVDDNTDSGIWISNSTAHITSSVIHGNSAQKGAGVYALDSIVNIMNCLITANSASGSDLEEGGGIHTDNSDLTIIYSVISGNSSTIGGGINCLRGNVNIQSCTISGNSAEAAGGGVYNWNSNLTVENCTLINNDAGYQGGGIESSGNLCMNSCIVSRNSANLGGGIYTSGQTAVCSCLFSKNSAFWNGGAIDIGWDNSRIDTCTIADNVVVAGSDGAGIWCNGNASANVVNSILWGNTADSNAQLFGSTIVTSYSCIQDWIGGGLGNISEDPSFLNAASNDYHLLIDSPCLNSGEPSYGYDPNEHDLDGDYRVIGGRIDMGADEVRFETAYFHLPIHQLSFSAREDRESPPSEIILISNLGTSESLFWSVSGISSWLTLDKMQGELDHTIQDAIVVSPVISDLSHGTYSCELTISDPNAANSPQVVQVQLEVIGPAISLNSNQFTFMASKETMSAEPQVLTVQNPLTAGGTLNWQIDIPPECQWLIAEPMFGESITDIDEVTLSIDPSHAVYGVNTCQFTVSDPQASNNPQMVTVMLNVLRPTIAVSPASFNFQCSVEDPNTYTQTLSISNSGYDTLNWQITDNAGWLSVEPAIGQCTTQSNQVTIIVNTAGLEIGNYTADLTITDANASNSPRTVPIYLHVYRTGERHVPAEYATIALAVNAAVTGDHVIIHPGIYSGYSNTRISISGKALTIRSIDPDNKAIVERTIISGAGTSIYGIGLGGSDASSSVIDGLVFQDFLNPCIYSTDCSPTIRNCVFRRNLPGNGAVCVALTNSSAVIENCEFTGNYLRYTNGRTGGITISNNPASHVTIRNCLISTCFNDGIFYGAKVTPGLYIFGGSAEISNCTIAYNYARSDLYLATCPAIMVHLADVTLRNSIVWGNQAEDDSQIGVIISQSGLPDARLTVSHSTIQNGTGSILLFPNQNAFDQYFLTQQLPDPNLINPSTLVWGPGNRDADPLFAREPNDGGDGWFYRQGDAIDENANNDYGDLHLKSQAGRFEWVGLSRTDFNADSTANLADFMLLSQWWRKTLHNYPHMYYLDIDRNLTINEIELLAFADDYLHSGAFGWWVQDAVTSPCIDAGDPADLGWQNELWPHGGRINMGAYGGTPEASMSPNPVGNVADLNHDDAVDLADWSLWSDYWLKDRPLLDSDLDRDNTVDPNDLTFFSDNWLLAIE